jgi:hypothetical protein
MYNPWKRTFTLSPLTLLIVLSPKKLRKIKEKLLFKKKKIQKGE